MGSCFRIRGCGPLAACLLAVLCFTIDAPASPTPSTSPSVDDLISSMTPEQKAASLMIIGLPGRSLNVTTRRWIQKRGVSAVILFPKNIGTPKDLEKYTQSIQSISKNAPLLIAVDQEGGRVRRLQKDVTFLPSAMSLGSASNPSLSYLSGMVAGKELLQLGINVNLAPVLDLYFSQQDSLIGTRSFGPSPETVGAMGSAYIRALQFHGVSATAKHFPGHGHVSGDSHYTLPESTVDLKTWQRDHMPPFVRAIEENSHLIMTAHVRFPRMLQDLGASPEDQELPATMSPTMITKVLREKLKFQGVVVTDDLEMRAIQKKWTYGEAAVKSIAAGTDLVMVAWGPQAKDDVWKALTSAIRTGRLSESRINESLKRILELRLSKRVLTLHQSQASVLRIPLHQEAAHLIRQMGLTSFETKRSQHPVNFVLPRQTQLILHANHAAILENFKQDLKGFFTGLIHGERLEAEPIQNTDSLTAHVFFLRNRADRSALQSRWTDWLRWTSSQKLNQLYVISMDSPALLVGFEDASGLLCTFNNDTLSLESIAALFKHQINLNTPMISLKHYQRSSNE